MKRKRRDKTVTGRAGGSLIVTPGRFQNLIALFLFSRSVLFSSFVLSICYSSCIRRRVISRSFRKVLTNKASKDQILKSNSLLLSFSLYFHRSSTVRISPFLFLNGWPNRSKENKFTAPSTKTEEKRRSKRLDKERKKKASSMPSGLLAAPLLLASAVKPHPLFKIPFTTQLLLCWLSWHRSLPSWTVRRLLPVGVEPALPGIVRSLLLRWCSCSEFCRRIETLLLLPPVNWEIIFPF